MRIRGILVAAAVVAGFVGDCRAETSSKDLQAAVRTVRYLATRPTEPVKIAVVYDSARAESKAEASTLLAAMKGGAVGGVKVDGILVPTGQLQGLKGAAMAILTTGTEARRAAIFHSASANGVITVSTDEACAQAGQCVMSIQAEPRVKILVNAMAAKASKVEFAPTFRMMISEI